jgi:hypothetical protein
LSLGARYRFTTAARIPGGGVIQSTVNPRFSIVFRTPDATPAVIIGLDPMIRNPLRINPSRRRKLNEIRALLDCRVKPGNDGKAAARPGRAESAVNRTAAGQAGRIRFLVSCGIPRTTVF